MMRLLILGGTGEAAALATALRDHPAIAPLSSLAGRTANPALPTGPVRIGGFGGAAGLRDFLAAQAIEAVLDATHPFAARMSHQAAAACAAAGIPFAMLCRPAWQPGPGDDWQGVADVAAAATLLAARPAARPFLTIGRQELAPFAPLPHRFLIRCIDPPEAALPADHRLLLARGPFALADEIRLMRDEAVDLLVTKNSGGSATEPKLATARRLGIPVLMIDRPPRPAAPQLDSVAAAIAWAEGLAGHPWPSGVRPSGVRSSGAG